MNGLVSCWKALCHRADTHGERECTRSAKCGRHSLSVLYHDIIVLWLGQGEEFKESAHNGKPALRVERDEQGTKRRTINERLYWTSHLTHLPRLHYETLHPPYMKHTEHFDIPIKVLWTKQWNISGIHNRHLTELNPVMFISKNGLNSILPA